MKHLLLILLGFGLIGCATSNLYILEDVRESEKKYGAWNHQRINDDFNGSFSVSTVISDDGKATVSLIRAHDLNIDRFSYINGDSYICALSGKITVNFKFMTNAGDSVFSYRMGLATDRTTLQTDTLKEVHTLLDWLHRSNKLIIRTTDACGNTIDRSFKLGGTTHLLPRIRS